MKISKTILLSVAAASCALFANYASAVPTLTLSDGTTTVTVVDNGAGDLDPTVGQVLFSGMVGIFNTNQIEAGFTKPALGSASAPAIDLLYSASTTRAGTLTASFSESGFTAFPGTFTGDIGGTIMGTGISVSNTVLQNGMTILSLGPLTTSNFAAGGSAALIAGSPYSLTESVAISFGANGGSVTGDAGGTVGVPDGGMTVTMLGIGLIGIGFVRRKLTA